MACKDCEGCEKRVFYKSNDMSVCIAYSPLWIYSLDNYEPEQLAYKGRCTYNNRYKTVKKNIDNI